MFETLTIIIIISGITFVFLSYYLDEKNRNNPEKTIENYEEYQSRLKEVNDKIIELNDYSEFIKSEMEGKHKELLFLYHLTNEKSKSINEESEVIIKHDDNVKIKDIEKINEREDINKRILELANEGYDVREIARVLNIGQGEVKLVLNLFQ